MFAPIAYLGLLIAPSVILSIPFQILHSFNISPPSLAYCISASCVAAATLWVLYRSVKLAIYAARHGILDIDAVVTSFGFALAAVCIVFISPTGWRSY